MAEVDGWWRAVAEWLLRAPVTRDDERALFAVLRLCGAEDEARRRAMPLLTTPESHALSYWRQYFLAPHGTFEVGQAWWSGRDDEGFWSAFEDAAVARRSESADEIRRQVRSRGGRAVVEDCLRMWPLLADSPQRLARKALKERVLG